MRSAALRADEHASFLASVDGAVVGAVLVVLLIRVPGRGIEERLLPGLVFAGGALAMAPRRPWADVLSSASSIAMAGAGSALGALLLTTGGALGLWPALGAHRLLTAWAGAGLTAAATITIARWMRRRCRPVRVAIVGSAHPATELVNEFERERHSRYEVVGYVVEVGVDSAAQGASVHMLGTEALEPIRTPRPGRPAGEDCRGGPVRSYTTLPGDGEDCR